MTTTTRPSSLRRTYWLIAILLTATALRFPALFNNFWLDEIWSWKISVSCHHVLDILTSPSARIDNNHPLNTLFLYLLGDQLYWPLYRLPSLLAAVATIALSIPAKPRALALGLPLLLTFSYPLILYSTEARGYSLLIFFCLSSYLLLQHYHRTPALRTAFLFSLCCILGFLSHLTFAHFYLGALVWSAIHFRRTPRHFFILNTIPLLFAVTLYFIFIRHLTIGGSPDAPLLPVLSTTLSLLVGTTSPLFAIPALAFLLFSLYHLYRHDRALCPFYFTCILLSPALFLLLSHNTDPLFPRYFLISIFFSLLLFARMLSSLPRSISIPLLTLYILANLHQTTLFVLGTRGHYLQALEYITAHSPTGSATISADDPFRTQLLLEFYSRYLPPNSITYVVPSSNPDWFILNSPQIGFTPSGPLLLNDTPYPFSCEFTHYGLSGWSWYLFQRSSSIQPK